MKYKVLALDLDGTLTNHEKKITPRTKTALLAAVDAGVTIVLASGRPTVGIRSLAEELDLSRRGGCILSYNGGRIENCKTGEVPVQIEFPFQYIEQVCRFARENGLTALTYNDKGIVTENPTDRYVIEEMRTNNIPAFFVSDLLAEVTYPVNKFMLVGDPNVCVAAEEKMQQQFAGKLSIYRSQPFFIEVMPLNVEKAASLGLLLERMGLQRENLMACGDGWNDLPMIEFAGLGVAMDNAVPPVKEAADYITEDNEHDGVGLAVEKFILGREEPQ